MNNEEIIRYLNTHPSLDCRNAEDREAVQGAIDIINEKVAVKEDEGSFFKLFGVMHFVDKWLDDDELKLDEVQRADRMREKTLQIVEDLQKEAREAYQKGRKDAIDLFIDSIKSYDTFGYSSQGLFRLSGENKKDYVPYIHYDDVIKCAKAVKEQKND